MDLPFGTGGVPASACRGAASLSAARRRAQRAVGLSIARRRLPLSVGRSTDEVGDDEESAGPNLFFRRDGAEAVGGASGGMVAHGQNFAAADGGAYLTAAFLSESVVLAADSQGRIDAVRMPRYVHPPDEGARIGDDGCGGDDSSDEDCDAAAGSSESAGGDSPRRRRRRSRERGALVASHIGAPITNTIPLPYVRLKSVRNGEAFVAGTPSGEVRLFATEHGATWNHNAGGEIGRNGGRGASLGNCTSTAANAQFLRCVDQLGGPRRRYCRELLSSRNTLWGMLRDDARSAGWGGAAAYSMAEIPGWNDGPFPVERAYPIERPPADDELPVVMPRRTATDDALWDFREVGSKVLAVNVDRDKDCFIVRSIGDIAWTSPHGGRHQARRSEDNNAPRPIVCVDLDSRENGVHFQEDITGVCFAGDHYIATAHVLMSGGRFCLCNYTNVIKWWDQRMMSGEAIRTSALPSFPRDDVYGGRASHESCIMCHQHMPTRAGKSVACPNCTFASVQTKKGGKTKLENLRDENYKSCMFISRLTAASGGVPSVAVSLRSDEDAMQWASEEILVDSSTFQVTNRVRLGLVDFSKCQYEPFLPPAVFTPEHDFMASLGAPIDGIIREEDHGELKKPVVRLFDLSRPRRTGNSDSKKRSYTFFEEGNASAGGSIVGSMPAGLVDSYGLQSKCTCMAINDLGTTLVCGSADGDLFAWQGG